MSKPSPRIPIHTCEELFEKLKWDYQEFEKGWTEYRTFNFVVTAYHLYQDWIKSAGTSSQKNRKNKLPRQGKLLFRVLRDITNASKHWELDEDSKNKQVVSGVSEPQIADAYAYFIAGPVLYISVDSARPSMPELASLALECFTWILQGEGLPFPIELTKRLSNVFRPLQ